MEYPNGPPYGDWWVPAPIIGNGVGFIPGDETTDAVLDLGNKIFGEWGLSFWMYVPSGKVAYWNIQGEIPIGAGEMVVGNVFFNQDNTNPGVGLIDDTFLGDVNFNFPHDEWFRIVIGWDWNIDIGNVYPIWNFYVNGIEVIPEGTSYTNENGDFPTSLGGINFFSISMDNEMYLDDFNYQDSIIMDNEDFSEKDFTIYPNPAQSLLNISSQESINNISIYNSLGNLIKESLGETTLDVSYLKSGLYFIEVTTDSNKSVQKFIKN